MTSLYEELRLAGLPNNEAKVYLKLLQLGKANGNLLAKKCSLDRSFTYTLVNSLIEKGLVSFIMEKNKRIYQPTDPKNLLLPIKEKEMLITALIPKLASITPKNDSENDIRVYEGKEGLKVMLNEALEEDGEMLFFGGTGKSYDVLRWEMPHHIKRFIKAKKHMRGIISEQYKDHEMKNLPRTKIKSIKKLDAEATTTIAGDNISIHLIRDDEKPFIIIIKNKAIAATYKSFFEAMWTQAK